MAAFDAVFVGAGINSLAGAALLSKAGWSVCVLERSDELGGCIRTSRDLTAPAFTHEVLASWHPLWVGSSAYAELKDELDRCGLEYLNTELPTGSAFPDGSSVCLSTSLDANVAELARHAETDGPAWEAMFNAFMANADLSFGVLGTELWSPAGLGLGRRALRRFGRRGLLAFVGTVLASSRDWLGDTFESDAARGLLAPWVLHTGLGPDQAASGFMTQVIACALQIGGMPVPKGGGVVLVDALRNIIRDAGGEVRTNAEVERVLVSDGKATAVRLAGGETIRAGRAVVASVTPTQLYDRLLSSGDAPDEVVRAARRYRYGRGAMQIHMALSEPPDWYGDDRLARTAIVHVTPGLDGVSRAVNEADRGLLPAEATIVCGQPVAVDPSRAPEGSWIIWIQLQELPAGRVKGDAAAEIDVGDGRWTEELREAYADRIVARLGRHIQNLERATLRRVALSPADIATLNVNLVGGDIYGGSCALDQNFVFRPLAHTPGHRTPVDNLWHIGASTHPGPGLGAGSGYLVYQELTRRPALPRRMFSKVPVIGR
jgi:phytoene dehydrogenase-like protein